MSRITLKARREWAEQALLHYNGEREGSREIVDTPQDDLCDLLTDLMHYCTVERIDFEHALRCADMHHTHESRKAKGLRCLELLGMVSRMQRESEHDDYDTQFEESSRFGEDAPSTLNGLIIDARDILAGQP